ncbi:MAG TPA: RNA methyltransferase [Firmicutes bacterium]|nr:RNA methyltransferase [Bacillota bacterium]
MSDVYLALLHWPVLNKDGRVVATAITCFDLHDIARAALTYGVRRYFLVNPLSSQRKLAERITRYWQSGPSADWNPTRRDAFQIVRVVERLEDVIAAIRDEAGKAPRVVVTTARPWPRAVGCEWLRRQMAADEGPWLLLFGTGWGLAEEVKEQADYVLEPIVGPGAYNHLSVRAAVAVILDRLLAPGAQGRQGLQREMSSVF